MKKIKKITKNVAKVFGMSTIAAVTLFSAAVTVQAYSVTILGKYSVSLNTDRTFNPASQMYGYFETKNSQHGPRAGTHFNPGSLSGGAYTELYYRTTTSSEVLVQPKGYVSGGPNEWICSEWVEVPEDYTAVLSLAFIGEKFNNNGTIIAKEVTYVNR